MKELAKSYEHAEYESKIAELWEKSGFSNPDNLEGEPYSIFMPPPNVTGVLHAGHALENAIMDTMARFQRMRGKKVLLLPGTDHAALPTQAKVEKLLMAKGIKNPREELGREKLLQEIRTFSEQSKSTILNQIKKLGTSCDWSRLAYTFDEPRSRAVNEIFGRMYNDGLIYRGYRVVNWSLKGQSTLSDDELVYIERKAKLYTFSYAKKWKDVETGTVHENEDFPLIISSTRPETKLGDTAVAVHPGDERFQKYIGKTYELYDIGQAGHTLHIKVIASDSVDPNFGTGALGVTPAHSQIDFEMYLKQKADGNPIELIQVVGTDGKMTVVAGENYTGLSVEEGREKFVEYLKDNNLLQQEEETVQNVGTSDRFGDVAEALPMTQWFVDVNKIIPGRGKSLKDLMREAVTTGHNGDKKQKVAITPERFGKIYLKWIENLRDWCISRQIWWGHRIPAYYDISDSENAAGAISFGLEKGLIKRSDFLEKELAEIKPNYAVYHEDKICTLSFSQLTYLVNKNLITWNEVKEKANRLFTDKCKKILITSTDVVPNSAIQDPDTLDTWFSSGLWTFSTLGWPLTTVHFVRHGEAENNVQNKMNDETDGKYYPLTERGKEQIKQLAESMKNFPVEIIIASPLQRTRETAEILAKNLGVVVEYDDRLREIGMGQMNGKTGEAIDEIRKDEDEMRKLGVETFDELGRRTDEFMNELLQKYRGKKILVISHGDPIMALEQFGSRKVRDISQMPKRGVVTTKYLDNSGKFCDDLLQFHPASFMQMGHEILFFWMARMILMSTYTLDQIPFKDVYIHGILRDEHGKKFSKSSGNALDPLEVIAEYGTDALRYGLLSGITPGNDSRFYNEKMEGSRNLVNKLWNISRFMLLNIQEPKAIIEKLEPKTLADGWILHRLNEVVSTVTENIEKYNFSFAAEVLREFTWSDLADWYLEIAKIEGEKSEILNYVLNAVLKLWHPFTPFVTEAIWQEVYKDEKIPLMILPWPQSVETKTDDSIQNFETVKKIISGIRSLRADYKIEPAKKLNVSVFAGEKLALCEQNKDIFVKLGRIENIVLARAGQKPEQSVGGIFESVEVYIDLLGVVDLEKEKVRLAKELEEAKKYVATLDKKLSNEEFVKNAPEAVVEVERKKLSDQQEKVEKLGNQLRNLN